MAKRRGRLVLKTQLDAVAVGLEDGTAADNTMAALNNDIAAMTTQIAGKVDKIAGLALSHNDFTDDAKIKLDSIAPGATANDTDANLRNRANQTGTQPVATIDGLQAALDNKSDIGHIHTVAQITDFASACDSRIVAMRGSASGLAPLDETGKIPAAYLPSYVDDITDYDNQSSFPPFGETGKIYVAKNTNKIYRWSGSVYVELETAAVNSVFGRIGNVIASAGDYTMDMISDGAVNRLFSTAEKTKLGNIPSNATQNSADAFLLARGNHTGIQEIFTINGLQAALDLKASITYVNGLISTITGVVPATLDTLQEIDAALNNDPNFGSTVMTALSTKVDKVTGKALSTNDYTTAEKTKLTGIADGATVNSTDSYLLSRANHTGSQASTTISDFVEAAQDAVGAALSSEFVYNDTANTIGLRARVLTNTTPTVNVAAQLSASRDALVLYALDVQVSSLLLGNASGTIVLQYADNAGMTTNLVTLAGGINSTSGVLSLVNGSTVFLGGIIPAGKYRKITVTTSGTATITARPGQELLF